METNCYFVVKTKNQKHLAMLYDLMGKVIEANEREFIDTISEIDEENQSFVVDLDVGCGVNALEYILAIDYLFKKNNITGICFDVEGVEDLDYGSYTAFMLNYNDGDIAVKSVSFEAEDYVEDDYYDDDDEEDDYCEDDIDSLTEEEIYEDAEKEAFERLKDMSFLTNINDHRMVGNIVPIDENLLDNIVVTFTPTGVKYKAGRAVVGSDDEWLNEPEWDDLFEELLEENDDEE